MPGTKRKASWRLKRTRGAKRARTSRLRSTRRKALRMGRFRRTRMTRSLGLIAPTSLMCKFKYTGLWSATYSTPGTTDKLNFYMNNPYDPIPGASLPKCTGFDQLMDLYEFGICYACKVTARSYFSLSTAAPVVSYIHCDSSRASYNRTLTLDEVTESTLANRWKFLMPPLIDPSQRINFKPLKAFKTVKSVEKKTELEPSDYRFTKSAGPTMLPQLHIGFVRLASSDTGFTIYSFIQIKYYCKLMEKKIIGA